MENILHKYLKPLELFDSLYDMFQHNVKHIVRLVEAKNKKKYFRFRIEKEKLILVDRVYLILLQFHSFVVVDIHLNYLFYLHLIHY